MAAVAVGWLASACGILVGLPQMLRLLRSGSVAGLSLLSWQAMVVVNLTWAAHGLTISQFPLIITNVIGLAWSAAVTLLIGRHLHRRPAKILLAPVLACSALIACDQVLGSAAFGAAAVVPALVAALGQSAQLVRAPNISGVSAPFLVLAALNQAFWLTWAVLVADSGTTIIAAVTGCLAVFNLTCWAYRSARHRPLSTTGRAPTGSPATTSAATATPATTTTAVATMAATTRSVLGTAPTRELTSATPRTEPIR